MSALRSRRSADVLRLPWVVAHPARIASRAEDAIAAAILLAATMSHSELSGKLKA
jgi:hypothetical protein